MSELTIYTKDWIWTSYEIFAQVDEEAINARCRKFMAIGGNFALIQEMKEVYARAVHCNAQSDMYWKSYLEDTDEATRDYDEETAMRFGESCMRLLLILNGWESEYKVKFLHPAINCKHKEKALALKQLINTQIMAGRKESRTTGNFPHGLFIFDDIEETY